MDQSSQLPSAAAPARPAARAVLLVTVGAAFLSSLDLFVVNVAFDAIGRDFGGGDRAARRRGT